MGTTHEVHSLSASCHSCSQPLAEETGLHWGSDTGLSAPAREGRRIQWPVMSAGATCAMSAAAAARTIAASRDVTTTCASPARTAPRRTVAATQVTSVCLSLCVCVFLSLKHTHARAHRPYLPGRSPTFSPVKSDGAEQCAYSSPPLGVWRRYATIRSTGQFWALRTEWQNCTVRHS